MHSTRPIPHLALAPAAPTAAAPAYVWLLECGRGILAADTREESLQRLMRLHRALAAVSRPGLRIGVRLARAHEQPGQLYRHTPDGLRLVRPASVPPAVSDAFGLALMGATP